MTTWVKYLSPHVYLLIILTIYAGLALAYTTIVPLGEAPDEPAHVMYASFIATHGRLPTTLAERAAAGYRSAWPPLYHFLAAIPQMVIGNAAPAHLKNVGDTPRRLLPTNGQTIAAFIHTDDEAWPWRGLPLSWHLGRFISILLTLGGVVITYALAWRITQHRSIALGSAAIQAFSPQMLFIGSTLNDDNLLFVCSGLILLTLVGYAQRTAPLKVRHTFFVGILLGLATVAKYNALPLWPLAFIWLAWLIFRPVLRAGLSHFWRLCLTGVLHLVALFSGAMLTAGWWFVFIGYYFNQVNTQGLWRGSLTAFTAATSDAALQKMTTGGAAALPPLAAWLEWFVTLFKSCWGLFGGGGTIALPAWAYGLLAVMCLVAAARITYHVSRVLYRVQAQVSLIPHPSREAFILLLLTPLFFLPLPILRFILTEGNIVETAQGRHLLPAMPVIALALVWGVSSIGCRVSGVKYQGASTRLQSFTQYPKGTMYVIRNTHYVPAIIVLFLSLYALPLIAASYPPPIPLRTTLDAAMGQPVKVKLADSVTLMGYDLGTVNQGVLPVTLLWQAEAVPPEDYLIDLTLADSSGRVMGGWLGQPIGGRYPTRAWDKGDILRDTIPLPLLPGVFTAQTVLTLKLLDAKNQPVTPPFTLTTNLPSVPQSSPATLSPGQLRADGLPAESPFTYRSTLSFVLPGVTSPPALTSPTGQIFSPTRIISNSTSSIAHFIVAANWPSGEYTLPLLPTPYSLIPIHNRPRQFNPPPMAYFINANFAGAITLLGYDLPQRRVQPGQSFPVTLHLRAERALGQNLVIFNHLLDGQAVQRGGGDRVPLKYYTTLLWAPGEIVSDAYPVAVEQDAPPGIYWLDVGLYPHNQPHVSLPLVVNGQPIDRTGVRLVPLKIGGPPPGVTLSEIHPQNSVNQNFGGQITLLGFNLTDNTGKPISTTTCSAPSTNLTLFWRAETIPAADYTVFVHLLDASGHLASQFDSPPAAGAYPTSLWDAGEIIADERQLSGLPPGRYTLQVGLYRPETGERLTVEGRANGAVRLMEFEVKDKP